MKYTLYLLFFTFYLLSCDDNKSVVNATVFEKMPEGITKIDFENKVINTESFNIFNYRNFYNGGGVAIGDINNDGLADVFFTSNMGSNKLYLNKGEFQFEDISSQAGIEDKGKWSTGVTFVDINYDGYLDIYVANAGYVEGADQRNTLYINNKDLSFTESASEWGLDDDGYTTHAAFFDYDRDGDLDVYMLNNSFIPVNTLNYSNKREQRAADWPVKDFLKGGGDKLLRNEGDKYVDVSEAAGIYGSLIGFGLGVTVGDVNDDDWPDIYVSNDFFERDYLYINNKNGKFEEQLLNYTDHISHSSMGADMADVNNDGRSDIFVTDMLPKDPIRKKKNASFDDINLYKLKTSNGFYHQYMHNTLQLNTPNNRYKEISHFANVAASDWSWGALMFDMNNDSHTDIYICNGVYKDVVDLDFIDFFANDIMAKMALSGKKEDLSTLIDKMPSTPIQNSVLKNNGNLQFTDMAEQWGLTEKTFSNGAAYGDLDNDGDLDLVVSNENQMCSVYKNNSKLNFVSIQLKGEKLNPFAIGAKIKLYVEEEILFREIMPSRGFQSSVDYVAVFGLGDITKIDSMCIIWPNGLKSKHTIEAVNKKIKIDIAESSPKINEINALGPTKSYLTKEESTFKKHIENDFIDFYYERNIPVMLSQEGPKTAVADVNGDGIDDVFIGGAKGQAGQLYFGDGNTFNNTKSTVFDKFIAYEDTAITFFDADNDGDQDLFIGSGGNEVKANTIEIRDRLLINDGKGNFTWKEAALPFNNMNTAVAVANDYDNDGLMDLFVGNLCKTATYGVSPISSMYKNIGGGNFKETVISKKLSRIGMVKDAAWIDLIGDSSKELLIVGDWMAPAIFKFNDNKFEKVKTTLANYSGFWSSVESADLDQDGDQDLILGNIGENFPLQADAEHPLRVFVADFDDNKELDKIITYSLDGKNYPVFAKRELTEQLSILKKKNLMHKDFAGKSIDELFSEESVKAASRKGANYLSSCIAINQGDGNFEIVRLPTEVQLSSVNAILSVDVDQDNDFDVVLGGNNYDFLPQFSRLDASRGHVLINDGKGKLSISEHSGFYVKGEIKDLCLIENKNKTQILVTLNDDKPSLFTIEK